MVKAVADCPVRVCGVDGILRVFVLEETSGEVPGLLPISLMRAMDLSIHCRDNSMSQSRR